MGVFSPTYAMYQVYCDILRINLVPIGYSKDYKFSEYDLEEFLEKSPDILFVPNPNQPIESCLSFDELTILANKCNEKNCIFSN